MVRLQTHPRRRTRHSANRRVSKTAHLTRDQLSPLSGDQARRLPAIRTPRAKAMRGRGAGAGPSMALRGRLAITMRRSTNRCASARPRFVQSGISVRIPLERIELLEMAVAERQAFIHGEFPVERLQVFEKRECRSRHRARPQHA